MEIPRLTRLTCRLLVDIAETLKSFGGENFEFVIPQDLSGSGENRENSPIQWWYFPHARNIFGAEEIPRLNGRLLSDFAKDLKSFGKTNFEFAPPNDLPGFGETRDQSPFHSVDFGHTENIDGVAEIPSLAGRLLADFAKNLKSYGGGEFRIPRGIFWALAKSARSRPVSLWIPATPTILSARGKFPDWVGDCSWIAPKP